MKKYTVLLLYPDYMADEFGSDTYLAMVEAENPTDAAKVARKELAAGFDPEDAEKAQDFGLLMVLNGHHEDVKEGF